MTLDEAPTGSIVTLGHPANGRTATKQHDGRWTLNHAPHAEPDYDDLHHSARLIHNPEAHR